MKDQRTLTAFAGERLIATGPAAATLLRAKARLRRSPSAMVLVFDDASGRQVDFDWRGTDQEFLDRLPSHPFLAQDFTAARSG
ncbi:MAG TPA: DUF2239 family protein, partial [bacterium]|nr:DUF2239 family protein [bacterium]